jgi:uncharacterized protein
MATECGERQNRTLALAIHRSLRLARYPGKWCAYADCSLQLTTENAMASSDSGTTGEAGTGGIPLAQMPNHDRYTPVSSWPPLLGLGMTALNILAMFALSILPLIIGAALSADKLELKSIADLSDPRIVALVLGGSFAAQIIATLLLLWSTQWRGGRAADTLALRRPIGGSSSYLWAIPAFVIFGLLAGVVVQWLSPKANLADTQVMLKFAHSSNWWLLGLVAVVGAPIYEELTFRGFLFSSLARTSLGIAGTAVITSFLWALIHGYSIAGVATIFALGLALSAILWRTGSTRVTMACHAAYNTMAFIGALLTPPGSM